MTRFTVTWHIDAQDDAASVWLDVSDREAVTRATNAVDHELADDPSAKGEEVHEGLRRLDVPPLRVFYVVNNDDRIVEVQRICLFDT